MKQLYKAHLFRFLMHAFQDPPLSNSTVCASSSMVGTNVPCSSKYSQIQNKQELITRNFLYVTPPPPISQPLQQEDTKPRLWLSESERRHGSTRVPGQAFFARRSSLTDSCVHLLYNSSWKFHQLAAGQLLSGQQVRTEKAGGTARPSRTKSLLPGSLSSSQPGKPPCWSSL